MQYNRLLYVSVQPGKGAAFVRSKLKNLMTGNTLEKTFRAVSASKIEHSNHSLLHLATMDKQQSLKRLCFAIVTAAYWLARQLCMQIARKAIKIGTAGYTNHHCAKQITI
jgi:Elongation factor P (EF-P) KOW-like domain